jgi:HSP20 family molecular chaperone IbpA
LQLDLFQKESCFILYAALPAVSAADLEVVLDGDGDVLIIKATQKDPRSVPAEKKTDSKEKESMLAKMIKPAATSPKAEKTLFQEVIWRKYYRRVSLPAQISSHEIKAELSEGVLKVTLPMLKSSYKKIIEVSEKVS